MATLWNATKAIKSEHLSFLEEGGENSIKLQIKSVEYYKDHNLVLVNFVDYNFSSTREYLN